MTLNEILLITVGILLMFILCFNVYPWYKRVSGENEFRKWLLSPSVWKAAKKMHDEPEQAFTCCREVAAGMGIQMEPTPKFVNLLNNVLNPGKKSLKEKMQSEPLVRWAAVNSVKIVRSMLYSIGIPEVIANTMANENRLFSGLEKFQSSVRLMQNKEIETARDFMAEAAKEGCVRARKECCDKKRDFTPASLKKLYVAVYRALGQQVTFDKSWTQEEVFGRIRTGCEELGLVVDEQSGKIVNFKEIYHMISGGKGIPAGNEVTCRAILRAVYKLKTKSEW